MSKPILIYCGGGNPKFYRIALNAGFKYGVRLPDTVYGKLFFADQNWKKPDRAIYMKCLKKYKPTIATVIDWEYMDQFNEVLDWCKEASQYVEYVQVIPKIRDSLYKIPKTVNGKSIILGYSVPTKYGMTEVPIEEFVGWDVHLLGGSPNRQFETWKRMKDIANVFSIDGNYFRMKATKYCEYWDSSGKWIPDGRKNSTNAHYLAFEKSCKNIIKFWDNVM